MNYAEAREYMMSISSLGSKPGLTTIAELMNRLGNPQRKLKFIHVAGTNGKGSTCGFIANILAYSRYKVGRYSSPVVQEYRECIQVSTNETKWDYIKEEQVAKHIAAIKKVSETMVADGFFQPTYYEVETAMALLEFYEQRCDIIVLETLMGGRLDATNVVEQVLACVLTSISMDHMQYLGNSLTEIAKEKAGIIKPGVPVVLENHSNEVKDVIIEVADALNAPVTIIDAFNIKQLSKTGEKMVFTYKEYGPYELQLYGNHQLRNATLALECVEVLKRQGYEITEEAIKKGLFATALFGRFTILRKQPTLVIDGAHNPDAAKVLKDTLMLQFSGIKGVFIMGVFADKNYEEILSCLGDEPQCLITVTAPGERGLASSELAKVAKKYCKKVIDADNLEHALTLATDIVKKDEYILCFGSLSYLGQVPKIANHMKCWMRDNG